MIRINKELVDYFKDLKTSNTIDCIHKEVFGPGDFLIHQHKKGNIIFIIERGIAKCFVNEDNGRDFIQEFVGEGEILGEIEVFTDTLSFSNVQAITEITAFKVYKSDFYKLLDEHHALNQIVIRAIAVKLRNTAMRASQQQLHPIDYNLKKFMALIANQQLNVSKQDIADYLGITIRSLNRALKNNTENNL